MVIITVFNSFNYNSFDNIFVALNVSDEIFESIQKLIQRFIRFAILTRNSQPEVTQLQTGNGDQSFEFVERIPAFFNCVYFNVSSNIAFLG